MTISALSQMAPQDFLTPTKFTTGFDKNNRVYGEQQYNKGRTIGAMAKTIHISVRNVWSADMKDGSKMISSETIGFHANTADLLLGFIDSGVTIVIWREGEYDDNGYKPVTDTVIQGERS